MFAVTGATGAVGGAVAARLAHVGVEQRLIVRDPQRAPQLPGAWPVGPADYADLDAMRAALTGVHTLFMVSGHENPHRVAEHGSVIEAAVDAGVGRIVYLSFLGASSSCTFTLGRDHFHTEQLIRSTGAEFTFLRDSFYQASVVQFSGVDGVIRGPAGEGKVSAVSHTDVANAAAAVLLNPDHAGQTYDVTGPAALSLAEVAEITTKVSGVPVRYEEETLVEAYESRAHLGASEFLLDGWISSYQAIAAGELAHVSNAVRHLTGHPAQDLESYLRANPAIYAHLV